MHPSSACCAVCIPHGHPKGQAFLTSAPSRWRLWSAQLRVRGQTRRRRTRLAARAAVYKLNMVTCPAARCWAMGRCAVRTQQLAEATQERNLRLVGTQAGRGGRCEGGGARNGGEQAAAGQLRGQAGGPVGQLLAGVHDGGEVCRVSGVTEGNARKVRRPRAAALCQERVPGAAETGPW